VDCIALQDVTTATGWDAWSPAQAGHARERYAAHRARLAREEEDTRERLIAKAEMKLADLPAHSQHQDAQVLDKKRAVIEAALARARAQRATRA
jgi:electron transport complex protein RnfB